MTSVRQHLQRELEKHLDEASSITEQASTEKRRLTDLERADVEAALGKSETLRSRIDKIDGDEAMRASIEKLGQGLTVNGAAGGLYSAVKAAGWHPAHAPAVLIAPAGILGAKTATFFGGNLDGLNQVRVEGAELGADRRFLYPALRQVNADPAETSVAVLSQRSRTLPDPSTMIRAIDATSTKPEVASVRQLNAVPLKQVAGVESGVPNIISEQPAFVSLINGDLTLAFREALDRHVIDTIETANPTPTTTGTNLLEEARHAVEALNSAGYAPDVIALSPTDAATLDLLTSSGPEAFYTFAAAARATNVAPLWGLSIRVVKDLGDPLVMDTKAVGALHLTPVSFARFEENAGQTNTSTYRVEANAAFAVERIDAVTRISSS